jgi:NADH-quinone oxidoreductase subunit J
VSPYALALFLVCAVVAVAAAVATVSLKSALRSAMSLMVVVIALAGLYLTLGAQLLAALQLLVYAGAVVVLFVFVIMLIGPSAQGPMGNKGTTVRTLGAAVMGVVTAGLAFTVVGFAAPYVALPQCADGTAECGQFGGVEGLGGVIYTQGVVPFELVSVLLLVAIVGAIGVARGHTKAEAEEARQRRAAMVAEQKRIEEEERRLSAEVSAHGGH